MTVEIHFNKFPIWKGVKAKHSLPDLCAFSLGRNELGYIYQTTNEVIKKKVVDSYSVNDYQFISSPPGSSAWGNTFANYAIDFILNAYGSLRGKRVLEIGAGTIYLGEQFVGEHGALHYTIIDPSIRDTPSSPAIRILREYFTLAACSNETFDLVLCFRCLEHLENPVKFLTEIHEILRRNNGKAVLIFPDCETQLLKGDFNVLLHEHISYFTKDTFQKLANLCKLKIIYITSSDDTLSCLLEPETVYLSAPHSCRSNLSDSNDLIIKSAAAFLKSITYFNKLVRNFYEDDHKIAFHGACNGLNNILAISEFSDNMSFLKNILIFDGDEEKVGKYLPMCPVPILSSDNIEYKEVDQVFIAAMTYYQQIKNFLITHHQLDPARIHPIYP